MGLLQWFLFLICLLSIHHNLFFCIRFLRRYLYALSKAIKDGADIQVTQESEERGGGIKKFSSKNIFQLDNLPIHNFLGTHALVSYSQNTQMHYLFQF